MSKQLDLTSGPIWKRLLQFFFPILLGVFFQQLYNTVDALVVGNFVGKEALAAVGGSASQVVNLLVGFFMGLSSGATVLIAQYFGGRQYRDLKSSLHTAIAFSLWGGAVLTVLGILVAKTGLEWMNTPEDTMTYSLQYVRIIFVGIIPSLLYNMGSGILRALGDSRRPLLYLIFCCVTNTILDLLFVAVFHWEVAGAAWATILAQAVSAVFVLRTLGKLDGEYRLRLRELRICRRDMRGILAIGLPTAVQSSTYNITNLLLTVCINGLGTDVVAGWTAAGKADSIFWMIMNAFGTTILTFSGQNIGAGLLKRTKKGIRTCLLMAMGSAILIIVMLLTCGKFVLGIFSKDAAVIDAGLVVLRYLVPCYVFWVFMEIYSGALRGAGDALMPMVMNLVGVCALRIAWVYIAVPKHYTLEMICLSYPITWVVTSLAFILYYRFGKWNKRVMAGRQEVEEPQT